MKTKLKAVAMDMDGTLLNDKDEIAPETLKVLKDLEKQGVKLILASGRVASRLKKYADLLEMDKYGGYLVELDGLAISDPKTGERSKQPMLEKERMQKLFKTLKETGAEVQGCFDDGMFVYIPEDIRKMKQTLRQERNLPEDYPWTSGSWDWLSDLRDGYPKLSYIEHGSEITRDLNKIQMMQDEDKMEQIYHKLKERIGDEYELFRTAPRQIEILPKGVSKGAALKRIMESEGWNPDEVAAFGDGENDVSMFEVCDNSYAMGNAKPYVKEKAACVTAANTEDGIARALKALIKE